MSNIKKFQDFINEKKSPKKEDKIKLPTKGTPEWNQLQVAKKTLKMTDSGASLMGGMTKKEAKELLKKYNIVIKENLDAGSEVNSEDNYPYVHLFVAEDIAKGFTNGIVHEKDGTELEWDLEVNVKDWIKLDDEDIDMIADQIRDGKTEGNDPIDWKLAFGGDSFEEEEEKFSIHDDNYPPKRRELESEYTRQDIANQLDIDKDEFEDSADLGDLADKLNDDQSTYEYAKHEAEMLFDDYKENNNVSQFFTKSIGSDFEYNKEKSLFKSVINHYEVFKNKEGYLDEFNTPMFDSALKQIIKEFLGSYVSEKKKIK
jgi:hypothetical protein